MLHARTWIAVGQAARGLAELRAASDQVADRVVCLQALVAAADEAKDRARVDEALDAIANATCNEPADCARQLAWVGAQLVARAAPRKGLSLYKRALDLTPDDDALLATVADLAAHVSLHGEAAEDYGRLAQRHPDDPRWREAQNHELAAALTSAVQR
jgi:hypothetical protein